MAAPLRFLNEVDEEELGAGGDRRLAFHVVFLERRPLLIILLPGPRLRRVKRVQVEQKCRLQVVGLGSDSSGFDFGLLDAGDVFKVEYGHIPVRRDERRVLAFEQAGEDCGAFVLTGSGVVCQAVYQHFPIRVDTIDCSSVDNRIELIRLVHAPVVPRR